MGCVVPGTSRVGTLLPVPGDSVATSPPTTTTTSQARQAGNSERLVATLYSTSCMELAVVQLAGFGYLCHSMGAAGHGDNDRVVLGMVVVVEMIVH